MPEKDEDRAKHKLRSGGMHIDRWGVFAGSLGNVRSCTPHTWYWLDVVRRGKHKLTCSSEKCPWEPLRARAIFFFGLTVITSRIQLEGGRWLALISSITF